LARVENGCEPLAILKSTWARAMAALRDGTIICGEIALDYAFLLTGLGIRA